MRGLKLVFWGGALAVSAYGLARICLVGQGREQGTGSGEESAAAAPAGSEVISGSFSDKVEMIRQLKHGKRHAEAINLLLKLVDAAEEEAARAGSAIAAWYYEQLAILYRLEERFAEEVKVLERYLAVNEKQGGTPAAKLGKRLARARELLAG